MVRYLLGFLAVGALAATFLFSVERPAAAQSGAPMHPSFPLLDEAGRNVLNSGAPVSTMKSCGACHDTAFIAEHSFHADVGLSNFTAPGEVEGGRIFDASPGLFGEWNPLLYRYLSPAGDARVDLTTPEWIQRLGPQHVGGGPAVYSRDGALLTGLASLQAAPASNDPETNIIDPETGEWIPWDWMESGVVEMNCFLCHTPNPNNEARVAALEAGDFRGASTATLLGTGIVEQTGGGGWLWNQSAFDSEGGLIQAMLSIQDPTNENCGQCHGLVQVDAQTPLVLEGCTSTQWSTITTGQIISPQRLADSGLNLTGKENLSRSWDVHAERLVSCTDCHYALNNPAYDREPGENRPEHLIFDPRRIDLGEYLRQPLHDFANGPGTQSGLASESDNASSACESCHSMATTHDWLPYKERHTAVLACESCHVPKLYAPARQMMDWTVLQADGLPQSACRGVEEEDEQLGTSLISGFEPVLLPRQNSSGGTSLAPHNLVTFWFWVYGDPQLPVPLRDLESAWLADGGSYHPDILAAFDEDGDGEIDDAELRIDSETKEQVIGARLEALGLEQPRISGEVQPYPINHDITHEEWAIKDCRNCHSESSRITQPMLLSSYTPGGVMPTLVGDGAPSLGGELRLSPAGELVYQPGTNTGDDELTGIYVLGHDKVRWIDWLGVSIFLLTLAGASAHGGLRYLATRRHPPREPELHEVYMYGVYERLWHWLQTMVIFGLLFTGLVIHKPALLGIFSFRYVVQVHNVLAAILLVNAALAAFYHLASGEIRKFLPQPHGFFNQAFEQARFYLYGIFRGEPHPFAKTRQRKMNPLQQVTYLMILNVLLPLQIITGILMWGVQRWPEIATDLGGLPFLAPFHTLIAWLFASFIVMHVYLTTTGHTPIANIKSMMVGWDEVEIHTQAPEVPR